VRLDFKPSNKQKFLSTVSLLKGQRQEDPAIIWITSVPLSTPAVSMLYINARSIHSDGDDTTDLVLYSNHHRFAQREGRHRELEVVIDRIESETEYNVRSILWYSIKGGIRKEWMHDHEHRALFVWEELRWKEASDFLYKTMCLLEWTPKKETTYVPSLLYFHMKQWFEVDKIHIPVSYKDVSPIYQLSQEQKEHVTNIILWALENGDMSLPFFVELKHTWNILERNNLDTDSISEYIKDMLPMIQNVSLDGYRQFLFFEKWQQRGIEYILWLEWQNIETRERVINALRLPAFIKRF